MKDAFKGAGWPRARAVKRWRALVHQACSIMAPPTRASKETEGQSRNMESMPQEQSLDTSLHPIVMHIFFGRKTCLFGENESTALMDNAGEGTPGASLWEGRFEQKKPF